MDYQIVPKAFYEILRLLISRNRNGKIILINFYKKIGRNFIYFFII